MRALQHQRCQFCLMNKHGLSEPAPLRYFRSRFAVSQLPKRSWKQAGQRVSAWPGEKQSGGEKEFGERKLHSTTADVVTVGEMDQKNRSEHDNHHADRSDSEQRAEKDGQTSGKLAQADEIAYDDRLMHERGKILRAGTPEGSK